MIQLTEFVFFAEFSPIVRKCLHLSSTITIMFEENKMQRNIIQLDVNI